MNRLALALSVTSVIFAGTTVYFARELQRERASYAVIGQEPAAAATSTTVSPNPDISTESSDTAPAVAAAASAPRPGKPSEEDMEAARRKALARYAESHAGLQDPDKRAQVMREIRKNYERSFTGLRQYLDLTDEEFNRLLDILSEQEIRNREATAGCVPSAGCDIMSIAASQRQLNRRQLAEFMGAEKAQRYRDYVDNFVEREQVANFRGRLPDALRLTDAQAEKLTEVLGEERRRMRTEWEQRGTKLSGVQGQYGSIFYPVTAQGVEQRVAEAGEYLRRQRERAAEVLTAGQLAAFTQSQQGLLEEARNGWESGVP